MGRASDHLNVMLRRETRELAGTLTVFDVTLQGQTASYTTGQRATHGITGTRNTTSPMPWASGVCRISNAVTLRPPPRHVQKTMLHPSPSAWAWA
jgi:hypothetical protein